MSAACSVAGRQLCEWLSVQGTLMDEDCEVSGLQEALQNAAQAPVASEEGKVEEAKSPKRKRGRPKGKSKKTASSQSGGSRKVKKDAKIKAKAKAKGGLKGQCVGCGKIFLRSSMANLKYCVEDKRVTDRIYHAAKSQECTQWVSDQLSTLEGGIRLCSTYKERFPDWRDGKVKTGTFITQYKEMITAESSVIHDSDGIMLDEDRFITEMAKPQHGGLNPKAAAARFQALLKDEATVKDKRDGRDRVRVDKYSRLKQILDSEKARKVSQDEREALLARVMSGHNTFASSDVDLHAVAQQMALGAGKSASAFDASMMRVGDVLSALQAEAPAPDESPSKKKTEKDKETTPKKPGAQDDASSMSGDDDDDEGENPNKDKPEKWLDVDRETSKHVRALKAWAEEAKAKCEKAWVALRDAEIDPKALDVAAQVSHDMEVAQGKRKAIGHVLGYDCSEGASWIHQWSCLMS